MKRNKKIDYKIKLTKGKFALVDKEDFEWLNQYKWHAAKGGKYAASRINGVITYMHRLIMNTPKDMETDHISRDGLDNRKFNLRLCTNKQNHYNHKKIKTNTSGLRGVSWHKQNKKWAADLSVDGKTVHLGGFDDKIEAAKAYDAAVLKYRGEFGVLNYA